MQDAGNTNVGRKQHKYQAYATQMQGVGNTDSRRKRH
jgi:hypothetical protein